ncbi:MAG TPA: hypothetical protein VGB81_12685 [Devosia sp.]
MKNNLRPSASGSAAILKMIAAGWAIASLFLAFFLFTNLSMLGFPDGYITPYDTSTKQLLEILMWVLVAQAVYFLFRGFTGKLGPTALLLQIAVVLALVLATIRIVETCPQWDFCTQAYERVTGTMMDDGSGG